MHDRTENGTRARQTRARRLRGICRGLPERYAAMLLVAFGAAGSADAADWPQFRGPTRDGRAGEGPALLQSWPEAGPPQAWVFDELGIGYSSAAVTGDGVYVTGMEGEEGFVYALDPNGRLRWKASYGPDWARSYRGARTTPTVQEGRLYVLSSQGRASCFDAATGRELWAVDTAEAFGARNIRWGITESPLVVDGKAIFSPGGPRAGVVALDAATGQTAWVAGGVDDISGYCSPIAVQRGGRTVIAQLMGTTFIGIDAANGRLLWREPRDARPAYDIQAVSPVYENGRFYITSGYGGRRGAMYRLNEDGTDVTLGWRDSDLDCQLGGLVVRDGFVYGASDRNHRNQWLCLNLETGEVAAMMRGVGKGSIAYADGRLYTLGEDGTMGLVDPDPANFRLLDSFGVPSGGRGPHWAHPSIAHGRLYVRHGTRLFVYDLRR